MSISKNIPWKRLFAEGIVIIISILLAFLIDAWWNDRLEDQREREQLTAMRIEFAESLLALGSLRESVKHHASNIDQFISLLKTSEDKPVSISADLIGSSIMWRTSDVSTSALDSLIASGGLNHLDNQLLKANLAKLPASLLDLTEDEVLAMNFAETIMADYLVKNGLAEVAYANRIKFDIPAASRNVAIQSSDELIGLLMARRVHFEFSLGGILSIKESLQILINQIDDELSNMN
jgi:hypothetical protein